MNLPALIHNAKRAKTHFYNHTSVLIHKMQNALKQGDIKCGASSQADFILNYYQKNDQKDYQKDFQKDYSKDYQRYYEKDYQNDY